MNEPITLVALTGHKDTRPALVPLRRLEPDDLPELRRVQQHAYADGTSQPLTLTAHRPVLEGLKALAGPSRRPRW